MFTFRNWLFSNINYNLEETVFISFIILNSASFLLVHDSFFTQMLVLTSQQSLCQQ